MRSLELKIEGFTSFRTPQVLDFSNLELFAITGPTGAGKTSILDAMTYALYGHVARFGKDAKASELVSQGQDNLKVSFRFAVRGVEYRVTRTWRQRPKTEETIVFLEALHNNSWNKLETKDKAVAKRIQNILGMDFDTFTRVILLPQGKFDEFIKGNKTKRRDILRDLAGFEIFEKMRAKAAEQAKYFKHEYDILDRQQNELELPTDIEVSEKEALVITVTEQLKRLDEEKSKAKDQLDKAQDLFYQITRLNNLISDLSKLSAKSGEINKLKLLLQRAQTASQIQGAYVLVKSARDTYQKAKANSVSTKKKFQEAQQNFDKQKAHKDKVIAEQEQIEPQLKAKEQAITTLKTYLEQQQGYNQELDTAVKNQKQRKITLDTAAKTLTEAEKVYNQTVKNSEDAQATLSNTSPGGTRLKQLEQVSPLLGAYKLLAQQTQLSQDKLTKITADRDKAKEIKDGASLKLQQALTAKEQAETEHRNASQNNHAAALREMLHDGDNCPVCSGIYKEDNLESLNLSSAANIQALLDKKQNAETAYKAAEKAFTQAEAKLNNLEANLTEGAEMSASQQKSLADSTQQISTIVQSEFWQVEALEKEFATIKESDTKYNTALAAQKEVSALVREFRQALDTAQQNHTTAQAEYELATEQVKRKQEQLEVTNTHVYNISKGKLASVLEKELQTEQQALAKKVKTADEEYQASEKILVQRQTEDDEATKATSAAQTQCSTQEHQWQVELVSAGFTEPEYLAAVTEAKQQTLWQNQINEYANEQTRLETVIDEVKSQIGASTIDESTITTLKTNQQTAEQKYQQKNEELTGLITWMQTQKAKRQQAEKLQQQICDVKKQAETYTTLANKLKSDEFQSYILEHIETELVTRATTVLQDLTQSRYSLTIKDGDYWVRDDWNGGESRRVQTLSGGETFATSLSMALALSEKLSMGAELGSLFLDEGFGTLDSETLDTVYNILQSLQQRDKLIGVITHVKALGELLTQVKVYKAPSGSEIDIEF